MTDDDALTLAVNEAIATIQAELAAPYQPLPPPATDANHTILISRGASIQISEHERGAKVQKSIPPCYPFNRCKRKECQTCAQYRRFKVAKRLVSKIWRKNVSYVVLTLPNGPYLCPLLNDLMNGFKRLIRLKAWKGVNGYVRCIHIKYGDSGWHPHLDIIVDGELDERQLRIKWQQLTGATEVFVKLITPTVKDHEIVSAYAANHNQDSFANDPDRMAEYMNATRGMRIYAASGSLKIPTGRYDPILRRLRRNGWNLPICRASQRRSAVN